MSNIKSLCNIKTTADNNNKRSQLLQKDFRNIEPNNVNDNTNATSIPTIKESQELIENKFLYSIHIIFFVSSIMVFISIIPAILKDRQVY
jgi:hypothetical protein